jgi:hypothetical protein
MVILLEQAAINRDARVGQKMDRHHRLRSLVNHLPFIDPVQSFWPCYTQVTSAALAPDIFTQQDEERARKY